MLKSFSGAILIFAGLSWACTGTAYRLRSEEISLGVYRVLSASGSLSDPGNPDHWDTIGTSKISDFNQRMDSVVASNSLVFIGSIDSIIGNGLKDTVVAGLTPDYTLTYGTTMFPINFYLRIKIDTVIKGSLPGASIWIRSPGATNTCDPAPNGYKGLKFLNFSNGFSTLTDLKISRLTPFCVNCPITHSFDGRYLRSPDFPVLSLDIREVFTGYPVSLKSAAPHRVKGPLSAPGSAYRPDGRVAPPEIFHGKSSVPVLKP